MHTPRVAPKELWGWPCRIEIHYYRLALDKEIFGYTVPIMCLHNQTALVVPHRRQTAQTQQQCIMRSQMGDIKTSVSVYKCHPRTPYPQELLPLCKQQIKRLYRLREPKPHHLHPLGSLHQQGRHKHLPQKMNHRDSWARINQIAAKNANQLVLQVRVRKQKFQLQRPYLVLDHLQGHQLVQEMTSYQEI